MSNLKSKRDLSLPEYVHPLGTRYQVLLSPEIETILDAEQERTWGTTTGSMRRIEIDSTQDAGRLWSTLFHEYLHGVFYESGICTALPEGLEEIIVHTVETATRQFMLQHGSRYLESMSAQQEDDTDGPRR